jgi:phytoene dehydrogenase-like protein
VAWFYGHRISCGSIVLQGNINLVTRALAAVGKKMQLIPDPVTVHYHLPDGLSVKVHRGYEEFVNELYTRFPYEKAGIDGFFGECWRVSILNTFLHSSCCTVIVSG